MNKAFTLIELLVVVMIIGILSAVALPQYTKAVNKSRYAGLMPLAKSVKQAEEAIYMANSAYTNQLSDLAISLPREVNNGGDIGVTVGSDGSKSYVRAVNTKIGNAYVMYFDKSGTYPKEIHCEAKSGDNRAKELCLNMGAVSENTATATTSGYDAYVLEGEVPSGSAISEGNDGKFIGTFVSAFSQATSWSENFNYGGLVGRNVDGQAVAYRQCSSLENCTSGYDFMIDENGNVIAKRSCSGINADGSCSGYTSGIDYDLEYDDNGQITVIKQRSCNTLGTDGVCSEYTAGTDYNITYGNQSYTYLVEVDWDDVTDSPIFESDTGSSSIRVTHGECASYNSDGTCSSYSSLGEFTTDLFGFESSGVYEAAEQSLYRDCDSENINGTTCSSWGDWYFNG